MPKIQRRVGNIEHNMNKKTLICIILCSMVLFVSCGGTTSDGSTQSNGGNLADGASGDMVAYVNSNVNAIEQARPSIMVIPGDLVLTNFNCLKQESYQGKQYAIRDYNTYMIKDDRFKRLAAYIQDAFNNENYPLNDLEQSMKLLENQSASDLANNLAKDTRTQLLSTVRPDIILEMDYQSSADVYEKEEYPYIDHPPFFGRIAPRTVAYAIRTLRGGGCFLSGRGIGQSGAT